MPTLFRGAFSALAGQERHAAPRQAVWNLVSPSCPVCSLPRGTEPRGACSSVPSQGPRAALTVSLCLHPLWGHVLRMRVAPASLPLTPLCSAPRGRSFLRASPPLAPFPALQFGRCTQATCGTQLTAALLPEISALSAQHPNAAGPLVSSHFMVNGRVGRVQARPTPLCFPASGQ